MRNLSTIGVTAGATLHSMVPVIGPVRKAAAAFLAAAPRQSRVGMSVCRRTRLELASPICVCVFPMSKSAITRSSNSPEKEGVGNAGLSENTGQRWNISAFMGVQSCGNLRL